MRVGSERSQKIVDGASRPVMTKAWRLTGGETGSVLP
jgi:hypothetical protein